MKKFKVVYETTDGDAKMVIIRCEDIEDIESIMHDKYVDYVQILNIS